MTPIGKNAANSISHHSYQVKRWMMNSVSSSGERADPPPPNASARKGIGADHGSPGCSTCLVVPNGVGNHLVPASNGAANTSGTSSGDHRGGNVPANPSPSGSKKAPP